MPSPTTFFYEPSEAEIQVFFKELDSKMSLAEAANLATTIINLRSEYSLSFAPLINILLEIWRNAEFEHYNYASIDTCIQAIKEFLDEAVLFLEPNVLPEDIEYIAEKALLRCF